MVCGEFLAGKQNALCNNVVTLDWNKNSQFCIPLSEEKKLMHITFLISGNMLQWESWCRYIIFCIIWWQSGEAHKLRHLISFNPHESAESIAALQINKYCGLICSFSGTKDMSSKIHAYVCTLNVHTVYMFVNIWDLVLDENY